MSASYFFFFSISMNTKNANTTIAAIFASYP